VQNPKYTSEGFCDEMRANMRIPGGLLSTWGVVPSFRFHVSVAASQKNLILALQIWKKHFSWDETKIGLYGILHHPKGHAHVLYRLIPTNYAIIRAEPSSFDLKVMQP
jgi:hypothetical protein